jgi:hypothetical protein
LRRNTFRRLRDDQTGKRREKRKARFITVRSFVRSSVSSNRITTKRNETKQSGGTLVAIRRCRNRATPTPPKPPPLTPLTP